MDDRSFLGGMNVEMSSWGQRRVNFAIPLARLRVADSKLMLHSLARSLAHQLRLRSVPIERTEVKEVFRSSGSLHPGVGIETVEGKIHYFWTLRPESVLANLAERNYPNGPERRSPRYLMLLGFGKAGGPT
jgi:hypothetical protein